MILIWLLLYTETLLNIKEDFHAKPSSWYVVDWMPIIDMVFICPPWISEGAFQLKMDNIWFCELLLLFRIHTNLKTDTGVQYRECAYRRNLSIGKSSL